MDMKDYKVLGESLPYNKDRTQQREQASRYHCRVVRTKSLVLTHAFYQYQSLADRVGGLTCINEQAWPIYSVSKSHERKIMKVINVQALGNAERVKVSHSRADLAILEMKRLEKNSINSYNKVVERTNALVKKYKINISKQTTTPVKDYDYQKVKDDELSLGERFDYYGPNGD